MQSFILKRAQNQILIDYHTLRHGDIQIQMALKEINIELIYTNSSQAKGRIESFLGFKHFFTFAYEWVRSFDKRLIEISEGLDDLIRIFYEGCMVKFVRLTREEYKLERGEILSMRKNLADKDKKYSSLF